MYKIEYYVIFVFLKALQAAHIAEALHSDYLLEWMKNISNDLIKLEADAAPDGWKCLWNRYVSKTNYVLHFSRDASLSQFHFVIFPHSIVNLCFCYICNDIFKKSFYC